MEGANFGPRTLVIEKDGWRVESSIEGSTGKRVCIQTLMQGIVREQAVVRQDFAKVGRVKCPTLCRTLAITPDGPLIASYEAPEGQSVRELMSAPTPLSPATRAKVVIGVLRALADLARAGVSSISFDSSMIFATSTTVKLLPVPGSVPSMQSVAPLFLELLEVGAFSPAAIHPVVREVARSASIKPGEAYGKLRQAGWPLFPGSVEPQELKAFEASLEPLPDLAQLIPKGVRVSVEQKAAIEAAARGLREFDLSMDPGAIAGAIKRDAKDAKGLAVEITKRNVLQRVADLWKGLTDNSQVRALEMAVCQVIDETATTLDAVGALAGCDDSVWQMIAVVGVQSLGVAVAAVGTAVLVALAGAAAPLLTAGLLAGHAAEFRKTFALRCV
jgi:hypothetical protein